MQDGSSLAEKRVVRSRTAQGLNCEQTPAVRLLVLQRAGEECRAGGCQGLQMEAGLAGGGSPD